MRPGGRVFRCRCEALFAGANKRHRCGDKTAGADIWLGRTERDLNKLPQV